MAKFKKPRVKIPSRKLTLKRVAEELGMSKKEIGQTIKMMLEIEKKNLEKEFGLK